MEIEASRAVHVDAVAKAIDKGVTALRGLQAADGTWPHTAIGATALDGLTLLECGVAVDDKALLAVADAVRKVSANLDRLGDRHRPQLRADLALRHGAKGTP